MLKSERKAAKAKPVAPASPYKVTLDAPAFETPNLLYFTDCVDHPKVLLDEVERGCTWTQLHQRKLVSLGGVPSISGSMQEALPLFLSPLLVKLEETLGFPCDHVLINEYTSKGGIARHKDGPIYAQDTACILSLGEEAVIHFFHDVDSSLGMCSCMQLSICGLIRFTLI